MNYNDESPYDYAISQPEWFEIYGRCIDYLERALREQHGVNTPTDMFLGFARDYTVEVIALGAPLSIEQAYRQLGYEMDMDINTQPF